MTPLRARCTWRGEIHGLRKDGTSLWCAVNVTPIDHPTVGPAWIAVNNDITARRQAREGQARLASIVEATQEAILGKTLAGVVTSWNHGAVVLFGYSAAEMIGAAIEVLIPPSGRDDETEVRARVAGGLGVEHYKTLRVRKDGTSVDVSATLSPIEDADGRIVGIATICRDASPTETGPRRSTPGARGAARSRPRPGARGVPPQIAVSRHHEPRDPHAHESGVLGMAQLLLSGDLAPWNSTVGRCCSTGPGQSLVSIINDILDVSKMEAGKLEVEMANFDLAAADRLNRRWPLIRSRRRRPSTSPWRCTPVRESLNGFVAIRCGSVRSS